jgi:hypothetical protein
MKPGFLEDIFYVVGMLQDPTKMRAKHWGEAPVEVGEVRLVGRTKANQFVIGQHVGDSLRR